MGVSGCGWTSSSNVSIMVHPFCTFTKSAPNSASAADNVTNFKMVRRVKIRLLSVKGSPSLGTEPRNKYLDARLLEFLEKM